MSIAACNRFGVPERMEDRLFGGVGGGMEELAWPQPTRPGDVLQVESEIVEIIPSQSKLNRALVRVLSHTKNQRGEVLQRFRPKMVCFKRPA